MLDLLKPMIGSLLRHGLTAVGGGVLVAAGTDVEAVVGALMTLLGAALSVAKVIKDRKP